MESGIHASEIWELNGPYYRLPITVEFHEDLVRVTLESGVNLTNKMISCGSEALDALADSKQDGWWLQQPILEMNAFKSDKEDPEEILLWWPEAQQTELGSVPHENESRSFSDGYAASPFNLLPDATMAEMVWVSFMRYALSWLLNEGKPLPMLFATIYPTFLRANWKFALASYAERSRTPEGLADPVVIQELCAELTQQRLTAVKKAKSGKRSAPFWIYRWRLEIMEKPWFEEAVEKVELKRRKAMSKFQYVFYLMQNLKRRIPESLKMYEHFIQSSSLPFCEIYPCDGRSHPTPAQRRGNKRVAPGGLEVWEDALVYGLEPEGTPALSRADEPLPEPMPVVQP